MNMFQKEIDLTDSFDSALSKDDSPFFPTGLAKEFYYREGCIDLIITNDDGKLLSFEMKLNKWKQALHQAYRNSSFSHYSYIVLPSETAMRAKKHKNEFYRRGVGLCSINDKQIEIEIEATHSEPLRPWLTDSAINYILGENYD